MLYEPSEGEKVYEAHIYNKLVRRLVKKNQSHAVFEDRWADSQKHDVVAFDELEARRKVSERFSADEGFVIEGVLPIPF